MQSITMTISNAGIQYFCNKLVATPIANDLSSMTLPPQDIKVKNFSNTGAGYHDSYSDINIHLYNGHLKNYTPVYKDTKQMSDGNPTGNYFRLKFSSKSFIAAYTWTETAKLTSTYGTTRSQHSRTENINSTFPYDQSFDFLNVTINTCFEYNQKKNTYDVITIGTDAEAGPGTPSIPSKSIINNEEQHCFSSNVSSTTKEAVSSINFKKIIESIVPPIIATIPGSGNCGDGILYDFSIGTSKMTFNSNPADNGLQIGVTGNASYNNTPYPVAPPDDLPLPPFLSSTSRFHLNAYVSEYSINALQWAFFEAGRLNKTINTNTKKSYESILSCDTYIEMVPAFCNYEGKTMEAIIRTISPPVIHFQPIWNFSETNVDKLKGKIPFDIYLDIYSYMYHSLYTDETEARNKLLKCLQGKPNKYEYAEEALNAAKEIGMMATVSMFIKAIIQTEIQPGQHERPFFEFEIKETYRLDNLKIGFKEVTTTTLVPMPQQFSYRSLTTKRTVQGMTFDYKSSKSSSKYINSNIPGFLTGDDFCTYFWGQAGQSEYDKLMADIGKLGVPIPMINGLLIKAYSTDISIQSGYVSILAEVEGTPSTVNTSPFYL